MNQNRSTEIMSRMYPDISVGGFSSVNARFNNKRLELSPIIEQKAQHQLARQEGRSSA